MAEALRAVTVRVLSGGGAMGVGSGIVWRADGVIVTNAHVARTARPAVELADGRIFDAIVTRHDPRRDLATLAIDAADLPTPTLADPSLLRVGEVVLAFGNPWGVRNALTLGVVHAVGGAGQAADWIRADVRLAPGNSGGPLADARGRILGVNTMIVGGLGLAIPASRVERFLARTGRGAREPRAA